MPISATEQKNRLGRYLDTAEAEPVFIHKSGRVKSVLISHRMYERFVEMEDAHWAQKAKEAEIEGYLGEEEARKLLSDDQS